MKKLFAALVSTAMLASVTATAAEIVPKICLDGGGTYTEKNDRASNSYSTEAGYGAALEYLQKLTDDFTFGVGLEYQLSRKMDSPSKQGQFSFLPVYATAQYKLLDAVMFKPYVKLNLGYNMKYTGDDNFKFNGIATLNPTLYYAVGIGTDLGECLIAEVMYSVYYGQHTGLPLMPPWYDDIYSVIGINIGYKFKLGF